MNKEMITLDCEYSNDFIRKINELREIHRNKKYVVGVDYGNGKSLQVEGYFKINSHILFKKIKCGNRYKYFKNKVLPFNSLEFVGEKVIGNE
jgi:hypothetical protein